MLDTDDRDAIRGYVDGADRYFRELEVPHFLFSKPFVPLPVAGYSVARLAYLLTHLKLGPNHVVLDFGAGMGWLSIVLARMGCRVIALDVSATALQLGEDACRGAQLPAYMPAPWFVMYDGVRFPLPDQSVDRIACYDAMHHVPNKRTILREMRRVLRPGGLACFAEPGPGHSAAPDSMHDTALYGVLEDEVSVADFCRMAAECGFPESYAVPTLHPNDNRMDGARFEAIRTGARQKVLDWNGNDAVIVLGTGIARYDSRAPETLRARIEIRECPSSVRPGEEFAATARVTNAGDTSWLSIPGDLPLDYDKAFLDKAIGPGPFRNVDPVAVYRRFLEGNFLQGHVTMGVQLEDPEGATIDRDYARGFLPRDLAPAESGEVRVRMRAPRAHGTYALRFDMVDEYVAWFAGGGSPVQRVRVTVGDVKS